MPTLGTPDISSIPVRAASNMNIEMLGRVVAVGLRAVPLPGVESVPGACHAGTGEGIDRPIDLDLFPQYQVWKTLLLCATRDASVSPISRVAIVPALVTNTITLPMRGDRDRSWRAVADGCPAASPGNRAQGSVTQNAWTRLRLPSDT